MNNNYFAVTISKHADNAYWVEVESFRPPNAPRGRYTKADMERRRVATENNYKLSRRNSYYLLDEAINELKQVLAPPKESNVEGAQK